MPALRQEEMKLQVAFANSLMHTKGFAAPETKAAPRSGAPLYRAS
jgi:hypothetical protein